MVALKGLPRFIPSCPAEHLQDCSIYVAGSQDNRGEPHVVIPLEAFESWLFKVYAEFVRALD